MDKIQPLAIDISHHNAVAPNGFAALFAAGFVGVIHKADQGSQMTDNTFAGRRDAILAAGLMHGAYHFNDGEDVSSQVEHFFKVSVPTDKTLMCLDFEDNRASNMTIGQAVEFLKRGDDKLGRPLWVYSGNRLKESIIHASDADREFLGQHPLWCCQYGPRLRLIDSKGQPLPWSRASLWQFTGDGVGPTPHSVPGIQGVGIDINSYDGTPDQLRAEWLL